MAKTFVFDDGSKITIIVETPPPAARRYRPTKAEELGELIQAMAARWQRKRKGQV